MYAITRRDLSFPQKSVQLAHSVLEASKFVPNNIEHPHMVLTTVDSENDLLEWVEKMKEQNIEVAIWREPDKENQVTAICSAPVYGETRKLFKKLKLLSLE